MRCHGIFLSQNTWTTEDWDTQVRSTANRRLTKHASSAFCVVGSPLFSTVYTSHPRRSQQRRRRLQRRLRQCSPPSFPSFPPFLVSKSGVLSCSTAWSINHCRSSSSLALLSPSSSCVREFSVRFYSWDYLCDAWYCFTPVLSRRRQFYSFQRDSQLEYEYHFSCAKLAIIPLVEEHFQDR